MLKERKLTSVAVAGIMVASFFTASFANENGVDELNTSNIVNSSIELQPTLNNVSTDIVTSKRNIDVEEDLYTEEGMEAFLGDTLKLYSKSGNIKEDSKIVYQKEDLSEVTFGVSKIDSSTGNYYYEIKPDTRGMWKLISIDGEKVESDKFNFMTYTDIKDFNVVNNSNNPFLDENFMIKPDPVVRPRFRALAITSSIPVTRYSGSTRYETAVNISKANFNNVDCAIVVYGKAPSDALASTGLAKAMGAPILYTENTSLNPLVADELNRLGVSKVYVVGGSITQSVVDEIRDLGIYDVQRIAGARRSDTALGLANEMRKIRTGKAAVVVDGYGENDCLAVATSSGEYSNPMVYANNGVLDEQSKSFIKRNYRSVFVMSGDKKISQTTINELKNAGIKVYVKNETNSFNLSISIAKDPMFYGQINKIYVAANAPDGIPGSVLGARDGLPMLLLNSSNEASVLDYAKSKNISSGVILGGESSVSAAFAEKLKKIKSSATIPSGVSQKRMDIVNLAKEQLGKPYVWGAEGPGSFDCSGLVKYVYLKTKAIQKILPHKASYQATEGKYVSLDNLKEGDLVFWGHKGEKGIKHVGIYIGGGNIIHAPQPGEVVKISKLSDMNKHMVYITSKTLF